VIWHAFRKLDRSIKVPEKRGREREREREREKAYNGAAPHQS